MRVTRAGSRREGSRSWVLMTRLGQRSILALATGLVSAAAMGCGETVSLDEARGDAPTSTGPAASTTGFASTADGSSSDGGEVGGSDVPSDVPVEPAGVCEPGCQLELREQWRWVGDGL